MLGRQAHVTRVDCHWVQCFIRFGCSAHDHYCIGKAAPCHLCAETWREMDPFDEDCCASLWPCLLALQKKVLSVAWSRFPSFILVCVRECLLDSTTTPADVGIAGCFPSHPSVAHACVVRELVVVWCWWGEVRCCTICWLIGSPFQAICACP